MDGQRNRRFTAQRGVGHSVPTRLVHLGARGWGRWRRWRRWKQRRRIFRRRKRGWHRWGRVPARTDPVVRLVTHAAAVSRYRLAHGKPLAALPIAAIARSVLAANRLNALTARPAPLVMVRAWRGRRGKWWRRQVWRHRRRWRLIRALPFVLRSAAWLRSRPTLSIVPAILLEACVFLP